MGVSAGPEGLLLRLLRLHHQPSLSPLTIPVPACPFLLTYARPASDKLLANLHVYCMFSCVLKLTSRLTGGSHRLVVSALSVSVFKILQSGRLHALLFVTKINNGSHPKC